MLEYAQEILHGSNKAEDKQEKIYFEEQGSVSIDLASFGLQESLRFIQDALYLVSNKMESSRIIEESETHMHPDAQKRLIYLITLTINKTKSKVIIITHSPYILFVFNNLVYYSTIISRNPDAAKENDGYFGASELDRAAGEYLNIPASYIRAYSLKPGADHYCTSIKMTR